MDKEEFTIKLEEINNLVEKQDYKGAMKIVDSIDWKRVKSVRTLCVVGEIYAANKRYEDSKQILLLAYHRSPIGKNVLYRLIEIAIKMGDLDDALDYYTEFVEVAPNDNTSYVLKYKIYSARKAPIQDQIEILEAYKEKEYTERWSYELAKLYYKSGNTEKCVETCDDLILWFSEGQYVQKALELKKRIEPLTPSQGKIYQNQLLKAEEAKQNRINEQKKQVPQTTDAAEANPVKETQTREQNEDIISEAADFDNQQGPIIGSIKIDKDEEAGSAGMSSVVAPILETTEALQEKIAKGFKDIFSPKKKNQEEEFEENTDSEGKEWEEEAENVPKLEPEVKAIYEINPKPFKLPESVTAAKITEEVRYNQGGFEEVAKTQEFNFNLEDTIIAAATAQGIDVPVNSAETDTSESEEEPKENTEEVVGEPAEEPEPSEEAAKEPEPLKDGEESSEEAAEEPEPSKDEEELSDETAEEPEPSKDEEDESEKLHSEMTEDMSVLSAALGDEENDIEVPSLEPERLEPEPLEPESLVTEANTEQSQDNETEEIAEEETETRDLTEEEELEEFIDSKEPEVDSMDLIPRNKDLDDDEKKLFTYFATIPGMKEQIGEALADAQMAAADKTSKIGNIIIMGSPESGKTRLSESMVRAICRELQLKAAKKATVSAEQINGKNLADVVNKLAGGFLIIEKASQMRPEAIDELNQAMEFRTDGMTVILEDEKIGMRKMIAKYPQFSEKFTSIISVPVFTNDELVTFARTYAKERGYKMDELGVLALYNLIGDNQREDEPMTIGVVKDMVDDAIDKADSGARKLKRNLSGKRTDEDGRVILYEKDFK